MFVSDKFRLKVALITNDATRKLCDKKGDISQVATLDSNFTDNLEPFLDRAVFPSKNYV